MGSDAPAPNAKITAAAEQIRQVRTALGFDVVYAHGDLLPELTALDLAERDLRAARDTVLVEVRRRGASWKAIEASTGVPATTWRGRHGRFTEEE